jgi:ferredoxin
MDYIIFGKEGNFMKAKLDRSGCISCGLCAETCPEVFRIANDGVAEVYQEDVPAGIQDKAVAAQEGCPVSVITVE